jgi:hypothetical protein
MDVKISNQHNTNGDGGMLLDFIVQGFDGSDLSVSWAPVP